MCVPEAGGDSAQASPVTHVRALRAYERFRLRGRVRKTTSQIGEETP